MKNKRKIFVIIMILFLMSSMFLISYLFEEKIQKENENLQYNRFLEKISVVVKDLKYDEIKENSTDDIYEILKNKEIIALIALNYKKGLTSDYLIAVSFVKNEKNDWLIHNYDFLEYGKKDEKYVLEVNENIDLRNKLINKNINEAIEEEIVSGATISSNELYSSIKSSIERIKDNDKYK